MIHRETALLRFRKSSYSGSGNGSCVEVARFRKSSYSGSGNGGCVEVAGGGTGFVVRDSKDQAGPTLTFTASDWTSFVAYFAAR